MVIAVGEKTWRNHAKEDLETLKRKRLVDRIDEAIETLKELKSFVVGGKK